MVSINHVPRVSVIIPNYNHHQYLDDRINSVISQSFQDFELILLDDASTDNSREIINKYSCDPHVSVVDFSNKNSGGPFSQWDKGVSYAKAEWIWIAESDDIAYADFLKELMSLTIQFPSAGLIYSHLNWIDETGQIISTQDADGSLVFYKGIDFIKKKLLFSTTIFNVSSCIFRKETYNRINRSLFRTMKMCGDYYMYYLLCKETDVVECCKVLDSYRLHNTNTSKQLSVSGRDHLEGFIVLDDIVKSNSINWREYSRYYARLVFKGYYNRTVKREIIHNYLAHGYWGIFLFYYLYSALFFLKRIRVLLLCRFS